MGIKLWIELYKICLLISDPSWGNTVAMTRPKRHLCVVGDSETVSKGSGFLKRWMQHLEAEADLRYPDVATLQQE